MSNRYFYRSINLGGKSLPGDLNTRTSGDVIHLVAATLLISLIVSTIGAGYFIYGKKQAEVTFMLCGVALCVFPYFISGPELQLVLGAALMYLPFLLARFL